MYVCMHENAFVCIIRRLTYQIQTHACSGQYQLQIKSVVLNSHIHTYAYLYARRYMNDYIMNDFK